MNRLFQILSNSKDVFFYTFAFGLVAHGFVFFNEFFSHDSLNFDHNYALGLGRWGQSVIFNIRGQVFPPTLVGFFSLIFLSFATTLLVDLFEIKNKFHVIVVCGTLATSFVFTTIAATYIFFLDINLLSLFFVLLSCHFIKYTQNIVWKVLSASIFLWFALSLYQAYLQVYTLLCSLFIFLACVNGKAGKEIFKEIGVYITILVFALLIYKFSVIASLKIASINSLSSGYNSIENVGHIQSLKQILLLIFKSFHKGFIQIIKYPTFFSPVSEILLLSINIFIAMYYIYKQLKNNKIRMFISQLLFLIVVPFSANTVYVLSNGLMHDLMKYSYTIALLVPLFIIINASNKELIVSERKYNVLISTICTVLCLLIFSNTVFSNQAYLKKELESKSSLSIATRILDRIERLPEFVPNKTKVCFIGNANYNSYFIVDRISNNSTIKKATGLQHYVAFTYNTTTYFQNILGVNLPLCDNSKLDNNIVDEMPLFPSLGSVSMLKGQVVVKLGDN